MTWQGINNEKRDEICFIGGLEHLATTFSITANRGLNQTKVPNKD